MKTLSSETIDGLDKWSLHVERETGPVPALLLQPQDAPAGLPLILVGHGGGPGKEGPWIANVCRRYVLGMPASVLIIDSPAHGERAPDLGDPIENLRAQRRSLADRAVIDQIIGDWRATIDAAGTIGSFDANKLGYVGFSQGTLFGISVVAAFDDVKGAVFGIGGLPRAGGVAAIARSVGLAEEQARIIEEEDDPEMRARVALDAACNLGDTEVLALQMSGDEVFPLEGSLELFAAYPGRKRMAIWPGGHIELPPEAIDLSIAFLRRTVCGETSTIGSSGAW
jgi:dienelactone hydrolase